MSTMTASAPYIDMRTTTRPFVVRLRGGATGMLIELRHFARAEDAWSFYMEHRA